MAVCHTILFFVAIVAVGSGASFPSYIKKCKNDKHLNECVQTNGQLALQHIFEGDEKLEIPSFRPYKFAGPARFGAKPNLQLDIENLDYDCFSNIKIVKASWDVENRKAYFKLAYNNCSSQFDYKMAGPFKGHTLSGEGRGSATWGDGWVSFAISYGTETVNGIDYPKVENVDVDYKIPTCVMDFKNLSDASNSPEAELNNLLTSHWEKLDAAIKQDSKDFEGHLCKTILNPIFKTVPIDELFE